MFIWLTFWLSQCLSICLNVCVSVCCYCYPDTAFSVLNCRVSFFFFSYQKPTDFNRKRLNLYTQKPLYLHLTLNVLDDWYQTIDSMRVSPYYYPTAQSRVQISCDIVRSFGQLVILYCKRRFSIHFAFPAIYEMSRKTWQKKKQLNNK